VSAPKYVVLVRQPDDARPSNDRFLRSSTIVNHYIALSNLTDKGVAPDLLAFLSALRSVQVHTTSVRSVVSIQ